MYIIVNLTQHAPTQAQKLAGVVDLPEERRAELLSLLDVPEEVLRASPAVYEEIIDARAYSIFGLLVPELAEGARKVADGVLSEDTPMGVWNAFKETPLAVMVGGQPDLTEALTKLMLRQGVAVLRALTARVSSEKIQEDGTVKKTSVFEHVGFSRARP